MSTRRHPVDQPTLSGLEPVGSRVAGVDEAGRGPLAGAVFAAAVILNPQRPLNGLRDSKALTAAQRERLAGLIREQAVAWAVASASVGEIDQFNILQATLLAMRRAVDALGVAPDLALVDGNRAPVLRCAVQTIVRGDATEPAISAASILAKTERDADMLRIHATFPQYRFDQHKGYPSPLHLQLLARYGPCPAHRRSFAPVRRAIGQAIQP